MRAQTKQTIKRARKPTTRNKSQHNDARARANTNKNQTQQTAQPTRVELLVCTRIHKQTKKTNEQIQ
jgi:hypothetical protein